MNGFVNRKSTKFNSDTIVLVLDCYYVCSRATAAVVKAILVKIGFFRSENMLKTKKR